jgi:hypothetical protein
MIGSALAPILIHFCGMHHQKSNFLLISASFLPEAVEANQCYFFENWFMKLKRPNHQKPQGNIIQQNQCSFYSSQPLTLAHFNMRHPVQVVLKLVIVNFLKIIKTIAVFLVLNFSKSSTDGP